MEVTVGPKLLDCVGVGPRKCLDVNGRFFYEGIDAFKHEEGYNYRLKIERCDALSGREGAPSGSLQLRLSPNRSHKQDRSLGSEDAVSGRHPARTP